MENVAIALQLRRNEPTTRGRYGAHEVSKTKARLRELLAAADVLKAVN